MEGGTLFIIHTFTDGAESVPEVVKSRRRRSKTNYCSALFAVFFLDYNSLSLYFSFSVAVRQLEKEWGTCTRWQKKKARPN